MANSKRSSKQQGKRRVKIDEGTVRSFGGTGKGPKILDEGENVRAQRRLEDLAEHGRGGFAWTKGVTSDEVDTSTGFIPKPWRHYAPPTPNARDPYDDWQHLMQVIGDADGVVIERVNVKGVIRVNCVGPCNDETPRSERRPYTLTYDPTAAVRRREIEAWGMTSDEARVEQAEMEALNRSERVRRVQGHGVNE